MKSKLRVLTLIILFLVAANYAYSEELPTNSVVQDDSANEVGNTICPVSGEKVGEMGEIVKYEYKGKIYNLCCKACKKDFSKDPEKYSKIAEDEVLEETK